MLNRYFADMHIHIGRDYHNQPVKITGSKNLSLTNILKESSRRKGIHLIGVIDCQSPGVQAEIHRLIASGGAKELEDGGIRFEQVTLLLGSEIEIYDDTCHGPIHVLAYFPTLEKIEEFTTWLRTKMKNVHLSSQRYYGTAQQLQSKVKQLEGLFIPAHVFTPFKSLYGKGVKQSLKEVFEADLIDAIELGLSSDTSMADQIHELHQYTYLSNSDAHSLQKIAREYQEVLLGQPSFKEFSWALKGIQNRKIIANYGLNPKLGKYYTTVCSQCFHHVRIGEKACSKCQSTKIIKGVYDRIRELSDKSVPNTNRPPYFHHVPLEFLPSVGPKTHSKLLTEFGSEMHVIHHAKLDELKAVVGEKIAGHIINMRKGKQRIRAGGGGKYGSLSF